MASYLRLVICWSPRRQSPTNQHILSVRDTAMKAAAATQIDFGLLALLMGHLRGQSDAMDAGRKSPLLRSNVYIEVVGCGCLGRTLQGCGCSGRTFKAAAVLAAPWCSWSRSFDVLRLRLFWPRLGVSARGCGCCGRTLALALSVAGWL